MVDIQFKKAENPEQVGQYLAKVIAKKLSDGQRVLWLVSGGSAVAAAVAASHQLEGVEPAKLTVSLVDERFGPVGHMDSNWQQLTDAGFILPGATLHPVLNGVDQDQTVKAWTEWLSQALANADFSIGLFGIGADGHTAGILPDSPAVTDGELTIGYQSEPYYRITLTPPAISKLDEAVVVALAADKQLQLERLKSNVPINNQPAQALKQIPKLIIYNSDK